MATLKTSPVNPISISKTLDQEVDGLLSDTKWSDGTSSTFLKISYSFPTIADYESNYSGNYPSKNFSSFSGIDEQNVAARAAFKSIFDNISEVTTLKFEEFTGTSSKDALIRLAKMDMSSEAVTFLPSTNPEGGDAWFSNSLFKSPDPLEPDPPVGIGSYIYADFLHELGHSLGLDHSFQGGKFGATPHDSLEYSVMSYSSYEGAKTWYAVDGDFPQTLMMYDIAALQYMYGANLETNAGDTVYKWDPSNGDLSINGVTDFVAETTNKIFMTIWDGGGIDTYDFSNYSGHTSRMYIDLRPGGWTKFSPDQLADLDGATGTRVAAGNIANSLAVDKDGKPVGSNSNGTPVNLIENVIGANSNDVIIGNDAANRIAGGGGADTLTGLGGNDVYVFNTPLGANNVDRITDFSVRDDTIELDNNVFGNLQKGFLEQNAFFRGSSAHDNSDRIIYNPMTGAVSYDADGTGNAAAVQFAILDTKLTVTNLDFFIV
jgi:serralysin